jgi:hypothetical protein
MDKRFAVWNSTLVPPDLLKETGGAVGHVHENLDEAGEDIMRVGAGNVERLCLPYLVEELFRGRRRD